MGFKKYIRIISGALFVLGVSLLPSQVMVLNQGAPVTVTAKVDSTHITIGDVLHLTITAQYGDTVTIQPPEMGNQLGDFTVLSHATPTFEKKGQQQIAHFQYQISVYDTGRHIIPPIAIPYYDADTLKAPKLVFTPDIPIYVQSVLAAQTDSLKDIRPPVMPPTSWAWVWWLLGMMIAAGLIYYLWQWYHNRPRVVPKFRRVKIEPAHVIAFRELDQLLNSPLLQKGHYKAFFSELSNILRRYLANRYFIPAPEETSEEILRSAIELELGEEELHLLRAVLTLSDQIKFARYIPKSEEIERAISQTRQFITATRKEFETTEIVERIEDFPPPPVEK